MTTGRIKVRVASPCSESWEKMEGDESRRFCARCQLNVYNLSTLTIGELEALVQRTEGRFCGRVYQRRDGTALTRDCPVGLRWARLKLAAGLSTAAALLCSVFLMVPRSSSAQPVSFARSMSYWKAQARSLPFIGNLIRLMEPEPALGGLVDVEVATPRPRLTGKPMKHFGHMKDSEP
ncbi:hypothetical protein JRI60_10215 [Archangium violaceum]|uniref:hypothetical protein n=1 Tax=Archangium violaceum TaxID=83451 RepID=UPI001950B727|nr:hypothetical protein [Archangium violaceum]QRN99360.1 hypothetical protein JRI60_10215 [Archangium violaceum]